MKTAGMKSWPPEWQDAASYPHPSDQYDWRWGFVRRNPHYQADWDKKIAPYVDPKDQSIGDEVDIEYFERKYGIVGYPPHPSRDGYQFWKKDGCRGDLFPGKARVTRFELKETEVAAVLDLSWPLDDQLKKMRKFLDGRMRALVKKGMPQPLTPKNHRKQYPLYYRLLDACATGATRDQMAVVLFPRPRADDDPVEQVKGALKAARVMCKCGFWNIRPG